MVNVKNRDKLKEVQLLYNISEILNTHRKPEESLKDILKVLGEAAGMNRGTITLLKRNSKEISIEEAYGLSDKEKAKGKYKIGEGITGMVIKKGVPIVVPQIGKEPLFLDKTGSRKLIDTDKVSFLCVPIMIGNEPIGTLSVDGIFKGDISLREDLRVLAIIASMIARAVETKRIVDEEKLKLVEEKNALIKELKTKFRPKNIIGNSKAIVEVYSLIEQVAKSKATVLILGESGTGKELVASAIHYLSDRVDAPFIKVNCAALPENLIESELFGHEKGSFTGALERKKGRFELADGGTIFLDEIGELSLSVQAKILRVLQEKEFERVGGTETIKVGVRILAATNRDLLENVNEGKFREDLYYRLNVFPIFMPSLSERRSDIPILIDFFIEKYATEYKKDIKRINTPAIDMLVRYHWPGNVRELENCIERAVIIASDNVIHSYHLPPTLQVSDKKSTTKNHKAELSFESMVENFEKDLIIEALKNSNGVKTRAARELNITNRVMDYKVEKLGIDPKKYSTKT